MDKELLKFEDQIFGQISDNLTKLTKVLADSQNMISDLKLIADKKGNALTELESNNDKLEELNIILSSELKEKKSELESNKGELERLGKLKLDSLTLAQLIKDNKDLKKSLEDEKQEYVSKKEKLESDNEKLKTDIENEKKLKVKYEQALNNEIVKHNKAVNQVSELNKKIGDLEEQCKNQEATISSLTEDLNEKDEALKSSADKISLLNENVEKMKDYISPEVYNTEINEKSKKINSLEKDVEWLIGYAKGTDDKVRSYFGGKQEELNKHNNWLCNEPKDGVYKKFFGDGVEPFFENSSNKKTEDSGIQNVNNGNNEITKANNVPQSQGFGKPKQQI